MEWQWLQQHSFCHDSGTLSFIFMIHCWCCWIVMPCFFENVEVGWASKFGGTWKWDRGIWSVAITKSFMMRQKCPFATIGTWHPQAPKPPLKKEIDPYLDWPRARYYTRLVHNIFDFVVTQTTLDVVWAKPKPLLHIVSEREHFLHPFVGWSMDVMFVYMIMINHKFIGLHCPKPFGKDGG